MIWSNFLLIGAACFGVFTTLTSFACLVWVLRRRRCVLDHTPPLTIYKPLKGLDEGLDENLRSFFQLDYPTYQLVFCVAESDDPAIAVVQKILLDYPGHDAQLLVGCPAFGLNPKVESLAAIDRLRKHDLILISDSNVRVRPEYLRETAGYLADPSVGLVSNLFAGEGEESFAAALENLELNGFIAGGVAWASVLGLTCVVGKSMMMPVKVLEAIGGFASVRNLLAEDQAIGLKVRKAGYSVRLSHHVVGNVNQQRGLRWFLNRHSRWFKIRRRLAMPPFLLEPFANLGALGLVWALSDDSGIAWGGLLGLVGLGAARDAVQTRMLRGTWPAPRHLLLSPMKDLFLLPIWLDAVVSRRVMWRGHRLYIGRFTRLRAVPMSRDARRRARRLRVFRARRVDDRTN
jgi:ceramide glucosyltransferase